MIEALVNRHEDGRPVVMIPRNRIVFAWFRDVAESELYRSYALNSDVAVKWWSRAWVLENQILFLGAMALMMTFVVTFGPDMVDGHTSLGARLFIDSIGLATIAAAVATPFWFRRMLGKENEVSPEDLQWTSEGPMRLQFQAIPFFTMPFIGGAIFGNFVIAPVLPPQFGQAGPFLGSWIGIALGFAITMAIAVALDLPKIPVHETYDEDPGPSPDRDEI